MAIYSLNLGFISRSVGRSAVGFSAYISASQQKDIRTGVSYDYGCKNDVIVSRILAPEDAPEWVKNSSTLWNAVEQFEDHFAALRFRGDSRNPNKNQKSLEAKEHFLNSTQTAQTIMGAIPIEFTQMEAETCVEEFLKTRFVSRGLVVEYAIHWDKGNPHFHGLITRRALVEGEFAHHKDRDIVSKAELIMTRKEWEKVANKHLALGGHEVRIDSRSYADQGLSLLPTHHEGWYAQRLAERGEYSRIVADNTVIRQKNIEILCERPETVIQEIALKRTVFTQKHLEEEIIRRVGGDEKLFALLKAKVEGIEIPAELILKQANDNRNRVVEGTCELRNLAAKFTDQLLENKEISHRVGENLNRDAVFTSVAYKKQEEKIISFGDALCMRDSKSISETLVEKAIQSREIELDFALSEEQRFAISHLCSGPDLRILNGKAGTGKTTLLKAVAEAYQEAGYRVMGTSFQGKAVEIMEQEIGISCKTLDSFKHAWEKHQHHKDLIESKKLWGRPYNYAVKTVNELEPHRLTSKDVIIVDEANMVGNHLWEPFLKEVTEKGAKVLIIQDPAQIKSREPGDTGRLFAERFGFCETNEVVRQRISWQRECSRLLNDHHVLDGLQAYYDKGHLHWFEDSAQAHWALAQDYVQHINEHPEKTRIALAYRNSEVYALNQNIREALKEQGYLQEAFKMNGEEYAIGDRVRFTENDNHGRYIKNVTQSSLKGVKNGSFGTIESYDEVKNILTVCLDKGSKERRIQFNPKEYTYFAHGYAMGINKSEGSTFGKSFLSLDPLIDPSIFLVGMTRHQDDVQAYINREQFVDFKDLVEKIGRPKVKETLQDYNLSEEQKPYFNRVQQYRDLIVEVATLREEMEGSLDPKTPLYKHPSYPAYQTCFEEKKRVAGEILKDWQDHAPYVRLAGIRKDVLEVEAGLRSRLLSDLEHRASVQVQVYMDLVNQTRILWKDISQTHPGSLAYSHPRYEDYNSLKTERDSLAFVFQENQRLYAPFFKVTKDEVSGELKDYWGEIVTKDKTVYWVGVKSHAEAHLKSQRENLTYERLPEDQKAHFDVMKAYVQTRNESAAIYSHLQKQKEATVQETSPDSILTLERFHDLQKKRDTLALKIIDSPTLYQPFFDTFKINETKLLDHAVAGELREKITLYALEQDISKRAIQAQELQRILTSSKDYRFLKESGLDSSRLTFDIAFYEKVKTDEISSSLNPDQIYKPIQAYLKSSQESAHLWKILSTNTNEEPLLQQQWQTAFQSRNENASLLMDNQAALSVISDMRSDIHTRIKKQANMKEKETLHPSQGFNTSFQPNKSFLSADLVLQAAKGHVASIAKDLLGEPNRYMSTNTALRFGKKGSLLVNIAGDNEGCWKNFETGEKGNIIQLIEREKNLTFKDALTTLGERLMGHVDIYHFKTLPPKKSHEQEALEQLKDRASRLNAVSELHLKSKPIDETLAETYLRMERGIGLTALEPDLRYIPKGTSFIYKGERATLQHHALAAFGRSQERHLLSVQLTKLTDQGKRALTPDGEKFPKLQYGIAKGSFVTLQDGKSTDHVLTDRVFIAEGIETALSIKEANVTGKIVASMGIHNMENYQGSEKEIILCADNDTHKPNSQTHKLIEKNQHNFRAQGKSVQIIKPVKAGEDFNDVLKAQGIQGTQEYLKPYLDPEKQMKISQQISSQNLNSGMQAQTKNTFLKSAYINKPTLNHSVRDKNFERVTLSSQPISATSHSTTESNAIELISDYIQTKLRDIKAYEGTSLADEAKQELKSYLKTLQKNEHLFEAIKNHNQDITKEVQKVFQEQVRIRSRGIEM